MPTTPIPGTKAPDLDLPAVGGGSWTLAEASPKNFTMVVFYRGKHCPICSNILGHLRDTQDEWAAKGIDIVAVSMDPEDRAEASYADWELSPLKVLHSMPEATARSWGLWISTARAEKEPAKFSEPGTFWIKPDGTIWLAEVASTPFVRPDFDMMLSKVDFILENDYPPRGMDG